MDEDADVQIGDERMDAKGKMTAVAFPGTVKGWAWVYLDILRPLLTKCHLYALSLTPDQAEQAPAQDD